jgi:hypothetical protein
MPLSPEDHTFLLQLRERSKPGSDNPPTLAEQKRAIVILRCNRKAATEAVAASKTRSRAKSPPSLEATANALADLENM